MSWKLSSTVLRGGANGNVGSPLGKRTDRANNRTALRSVSESPLRSQACGTAGERQTETSLETCTILTTTPNQLLADIHDRMPVILSPANYDLWLDPGFRDLAATSEMLRPFDAGLMRRYPVSERVNCVANDGPECSEPIESLPPAQAGLF